MVEVLLIKGLWIDELNNPALLIAEDTASEALECRWYIEAFVVWENKESMVLHELDKSRLQQNVSAQVRVHLFYMQGFVLMASSFRHKKFTFSICR